MHPSSIEPNVETAPSHRRSAVRHVLFSIALWATYVLYWKIVLDRGVDPAARFSLVLLGLFIALQILFTVGWILHNDRLSRVHAGRRRARPARIRRAEQDFLGRRVAAFPEGVDLTQAPVITIRIEGGMKRMEAGLAFDEARSALGG
jgi:hypothetical protein